MPMLINADDQTTIPEGSSDGEIAKEASDDGTRIKPVRRCLAVVDCDCDHWKRMRTMDLLRVVHSLNVLDLIQL